MQAVLQSEWEAAHAASPAWLSALDALGPWLLVALLAALVVRALVQRAGFRAMGVLAPNDLEAVHEALRAAERRTVGEIVPVVVERSDAHPDARWFAALLTALTGTLLLGPHLPWNEPVLLVTVQLALGALGWLLARVLPGFARVFVFERRATEMAEEQALQEFQALELHRTEAATGVLIFVSLFERRVVVLGDHGIDAKVGVAHWKATNEAVLAGIARGSLRDGLVEGIRRAGDVLAEHFPHHDGGKNELPDRVIVRES